MNTPLWYKLQQARIWLVGDYVPHWECRVFKPRSLGYLVARTIHKVRHGV